MVFPDNLRNARVKAGYTQEELADKIGTSKVQVSRYESGMRLPNILIAVHIADILGVTCEELVKGGGDNV